MALVKIHLGSGVELRAIGATDFAEEIRRQWFNNRANPDVVIDEIRVPGWDKDWDFVANQVIAFEIHP